MSITCWLYSPQLQDPWSIANINIAECGGPEYYVTIDAASFNQLLPDTTDFNANYVPPQYCVTVDLQSEHFYSIDMNRSQCANTGNFVTSTADDYHTVSRAESDTACFQYNGVEYLFTTTDITNCYGENMFVAVNPAEYNSLAGITGTQSYYEIYSNGASCAAANSSLFALVERTPEQCEERHYFSVFISGDSWQQLNGNDVTTNELTEEMRIIFDPQYYTAEDYELLFSAGFSLPLICYLVAWGYQTLINFATTD